jgi:hypothetical protein
MMLMINVFICLHITDGNMYDTSWYRFVSVFYIVSPHFYVAAIF